MKNGEQEAFGSSHRFQCCIGLEIDPQRRHRSALAGEMQRNSPAYTGRSGDDGDLPLEFTHRASPVPSLFSMPPPARRAGHPPPE